MQRDGQRKRETQPDARIVAHICLPRAPAAGA
jgi:hypothetical protein